MEWIAIPNGRVGVDGATGTIETLHLDDPPTDFVRDASGGGLLRIAVPLAHYPSHFLDVGLHGRPRLTRVGDGLTLRYDRLESDEGAFPIAIEIALRSSPDGLVLNARIENEGSDTIPQVIFPQLMHVEPVGGDETRLQLGRYCVKPLQELVMAPDDAAWLERGLQTYFPYAGAKFNMKWFDYGDDAKGVTLYCRNTRHTTQGLFVQRVDRRDDHLHLRWMHYPFIEPGETWESGDYVVIVHAGDWYEGAKAYQTFAKVHYPYEPPQHIRDALGIRSLWPAVRNGPPNFPITDLPAYAAEIADPDLGIAELVLWHWWLKNGYPIFFDTRLGTEDEFRAALARCDELDVPISLFVSHHILRDTDETDPSWKHLNAGMQPVGSNWTYGRDYLPTFRLPFSGTHAMIEGAALSPGWRETGLRSYEEILALGAKGICFDVFQSWPDPEFNPARDGRPDEEGEKLLEFAREARALIHAAVPTGTFSGEHVTDVNASVLDYTWEWHNSADMAEAAAFRYVFPQYRLNANVNEHPRGALIGFMESALINLIPGNMHSYRLRNCPELVEMVRKLAALRRRFLPYFTEGQYRFREGLCVDGGDARLYTHSDKILVIAINASDAPADVSIAVDPVVWGAHPGNGTVTAVDLTGNTLECSPTGHGAFRRSARLDPDSLRIYEFRPESKA